MQDDHGPVIAYHLARRPQIPYYRVRGGIGYWEPTTQMKDMGFASTPCGPDGPEAHAKAWACNTEWQKARTSKLIRRCTPRVGYVYFLKAGARVKIGFSKHPWSRVTNLKTGIGEKIDLFVAVRGSTKDEHRLHEALSSYRVQGEWFTAAMPVLEVIFRSTESGRVAILAAENVPHAFAETLNGTPS